MIAKNSIVAITGASRGIGRAIAIEAARRGAQGIVLNCLTNCNLAYEVSNTIRKLGSESVVVKADVSQFSDAQRIVEEAIKHWGRIDILVNNAGILSVKEFIQQNPSEWRRIIDVHLLGTINTSFHALRYMTRAKRGVVVNISSVLGINPEPLVSHYAAAKAAIIAWTRSVAREVAKYGIRIFVVAPGGVDTDMIRVWGDPSEWVEDEIPLGRLAKPEEIAKIVFDSIENPYISGDIITISGGLL